VPRPQLTSEVPILRAGGPGWWPSLFWPIYAAMVLKFVLYSQRVREQPPGPGVSAIAFHHLILLNVSIYASEASIYSSFCVALWPLWLWSTPIALLALACLVLSAIYFLRFFCTNAARPGFLSPEFFIFVGSFVLFLTVAEGYRVLSAVCDWVDAGGPQENASAVIGMTCTFLVQSNSLLLAASACWGAMIRARARRLGIERRQRAAALSEDLPRLLVRHSSSLYRQASARSKTRYFMTLAYEKLREEAGGDGAPPLPPPTTSGGDCVDDEESEAALCRICEVNPHEAVFLPCGHAGICVRCASKWLEEHSTCPDCRAEVKKLARVGPQRTLLGQELMAPTAVGA